MAYKKVVLDDSILDIDSWLPQSAIDELVKALMEAETIIEATDSE